MGGLFSAQAADLHSLCGVYRRRHRFRALGELHESFPSWVNERGLVALCRFRDNILIATCFPDGPHIRIVDQVCRILEYCWDLAVLCDCRRKHSDPCKQSCHYNSCVALGYCVGRGLKALFSYSPAP